MTDHLREMALTLANQLGGLPHDVVARAEAYYGFLSQVPQAGAMSRGDPYLLGRLGGISGQAQRSANEVKP